MKRPNPAKAPKTRRTHLSARLTHKYVPGWADEDRWVSLTQAKLTGGTLLRMDDDGDYTERHEVRFTPQAWAEAHAVYRAHRKGEALSFPQWLARQISYNFTSGCRCEHDCCGHYQTGAWTRYQGQRRFSVQVNNYRNL